MGLPVKIGTDQKLAFGNDTRADLNPHIAAPATGRFMLAFTEPADATDNNISLEVSETTGSATYSLGPSPTIDQDQASVAALASGNALVVYRSTPDATSDADIRAKFFYQDRISGSFGQEILINVGNTTGNQSRPEASELAFGRIAIAWIDEQSHQIKAAVLDPGGQFVAQNITVSTTASTQSPGTYDLGLTKLSNGNFVVSWLDDASVARFRIVTSNGTFATDATATAGNGTTDVTELADGRILLTYFKSSGLTGSGHFGVLFNEDGSPSVSEFQISSSNGFQAVTALLDGRFMVAYNTGDDIFGRIMTADGTPDSAEFRINDETAGTQDQVHLTTLADGRVAVTWADDRTGGGDIYRTIYDPRESGIQLAGTAYADQYQGSAFGDVFWTGDGNDQVIGEEGGDTVYAGRGNDVVYGEGGDDIIFGGDGNDYISGELFTNGAGNDRLDGGLGADMMIGGNGNDLFYVDNIGDRVDEASGGGTADAVATRVSYALGAGVEVETFTTTSSGGTKAISLTGNEFAQAITGNAGVNILDGKDANDTLTGLGGNDKLYGGAGSDAASYSDKTTKVTVVLNGSGDGTAAIGTETDTLDDIQSLTGGTAGDSFTGANEANSFAGGDGNDTLKGGGGNDTLNGDSGKDKLTGGTGADHFRFTAAASASTVDTITDFKHGTDKIIFEDAIFKALGTSVTTSEFIAKSSGHAATNTSQNLIYDKSNGTLWFDKDGNTAGGAAAVQIAQLGTTASHPTNLTYTDFGIV